jgi:hypothetical protein
MAMTLQEIRDEVDSRLIPMWTQIVNMQNNFLENHGRYFQGLYTHLNTPEDGADVAPDDLDSKPSDQQHTWRNVADSFFPAKMMAKLKSDAMYGVEGHGFVIYLVLKVQGKRYIRSKGYGSSSALALTDDWKELIESEV